MYPQKMFHILQSHKAASDAPYMMSYGPSSFTILNPQNTFQLWKIIIFAAKTANFEQ